MASKNLYVFGNPLLEEDSLALKVAEKLKSEVPFKIVYLDGIEEINEPNPLILDVAKGIGEIQIIEDVEKLYAGSFYTMHDADLAFFLKLRKKIGLLKEIKIIAIPFDMDESRAFMGVKKILNSILI